MGRNPNGASTIYLGSDGWWHGRVTVGRLDSGAPDRRHVRGKTRAIVFNKVRKLERQRESGHLPKRGETWTVASWLAHWLENIARPTIRHTSYAAYRTAVNKHLIPGLGRHRLDRLEPEHLERLYRRITASGSKPATAHQVHRTARTALGEAVRRGYLLSNPASLARPPRVPADVIEPYSVNEVRRILEAAKERRNGARWALALALGLRQGEVLALRWSDIDLESGTLRATSTRLRPTYGHGCGGRCGKRHAGHCPDRLRTNAETGETKSQAGRRSVGLPDPLVELLRRQRQMQGLERAAARQMWVGGDWVFTTLTGDPLNPNTDYHEWKALLRSAGVREGRLHDARHTAATVLLVLGVPERAVMGVMGWSNTAMAARYQHVTDPIRRDVARRVGGLLWADAPADNAPGERK